MSTRAHVIGIDPSLAATGIALREHAFTCTGNGDQRLWIIYTTLRDLCEKNRLDLAVVEDLPTHAHGAGKTGMAQGAVRLALLATKTPYILVPPASLKVYAAGKGSGVSKSDMRMELFQRTGRDLRDDNQVDAVWLWHLGNDLMGQPTVNLPQTHRRALDKVRSNPTTPEGALPS